MAEEDVLKLFDSYWFEHVVFTKKPLVVVTTPNETNPVEEIHEEIQEPKIQRLQTLHIRSLSDQNLSSKTSFPSDSLSPNSVLTPILKLQTILSGKEVTQFPSDDENVKQEERETLPMKPKVSGTERSIRRGRKKKGNSKSLSDLEFDELKGFMDLGFVFSEKDKDSSLVSIIPGLQRLGKKGGEDDKEEEENVVSRPYLSEAWDVLDQRKKESPLMNFRIPAVGNEMDMKDHLRFWAHTVASTVR